MTEPDFSRLFIALEPTELVSLMYSKSSQFYDAIYHFKKYEEECQRLMAFIELNHREARSILDVPCGTGKHLELLRARFDVEGLDINPDLLSQARARLPGVLLHEGNMIDFDLGKKYDVVCCLFSSITYVQSVENLHRTIESLARHVAPDGLLIIEPLFPPEAYVVGRVTMNTVDRPDLKICWMYVSERIDRIARLQIHYMVGTPRGIDTFVEIHDLGLFTDEDYRTGLAKVGFEAVYDKEGLMNRGLYVARRSG